MAYGTHVPVLQPQRLLHASSAVDANDLSVDPLAVLTGEETYDSSDIDGQANAV